MNFVLEVVGGMHFAAQSGIEVLDAARGGLGIPNLDVALVEGRRDRTLYPKIDVTEAQARASGRFARVAQVTTQFSPVYSAGLARFAYWVPVAERDPIDDGIVNVSWRCEVDGPALVEAWIEAGAPLEWQEA